MSLISTLTDNFPGSSLNAQWTELDFGGVVIASNQCAVPINETYSGITSTATYDCTNGSFWAKIDNFTDSVVLAQNESGLVLQSASSGGNGFQIQNNDGVLQSGKIVGGTLTLSGSTAYNATTMKWMRIRISGTTAFFDYSADGLSWTNYNSTTFSFDITALYAAVFTGYDSGEASANTLVSSVDIAPTAAPQQGLMMAAI